MSEQTTHRLSLRHPLRAWLALLLCLVPLAGQAQGFSVRETRTSLDDGVYRLDARLTLPLSGQPLEALKNGVPLQIVLDIEVLRPRRYLWNALIAALEQRFELRYHALTERYEVRNLNSGARHSYYSLDRALQGLGRIRDLPLIDAGLLSPDQHYLLNLRVRLEIDSLPVPLRMRAYLSGDWWLNSGWYSRDLRPRS